MNTSSERQYVVFIFGLRLCVCKFEIVFFRKTVDLIPFDCIEFILFFLTKQ
jgi:hypothetical protein